jgi:hypothetical protein
MNSKPIKRKQAFIINERTRTAITPDGRILPIIDARASTLIEPSPEEVKRGKPNSLTLCMLCLACLRIFPSCRFVVVSKSRAWVEKATKNGKTALVRFILASPKDIDDFDLGQYFDPHAAVFAVPKPYQRLGYIPMPKPFQNLAKGKAQPPASDPIPAPKPPKRHNPLSRWASRKSLRGLSYP